MNLEELEQEVGQTVVELAAHPDASTVQFAVYYILEVVKRWRTKGITRVRVRQLAWKAVEQRLRNEGAQRLKEMMNNVPTLDKLELTDGAALPGGEDDTPAPAEPAEQPARPVLQTAAVVGRPVVETKTGERAAGRERDADVEPPPDVGHSFAAGEGSREGSGKPLREAADVPAFEGAGRVPSQPERREVAVDPVQPTMGRTAATYTVCVKCGTIAGNLVADAKKVYLPGCPNCPKR